LLLHNTHYLPYDPWYVFRWPAWTEVDWPVLLSEKIGASLPRLFTWAGTADVVLPIFLLLCSELGRRQQHSTARTGCMVSISTFIAVHCFLSADFFYFLFFTPIALALVAERLSCSPSWIKPLENIFLFIGLGLFISRTIISPHQALANGSFGQIYHAHAPEVVERVRDHLKALQLPESAVVAGGDQPWTLALDASYRLIPLPPFPNDIDTLRRIGLDIMAIVLPSSLRVSGEGVRPAGWDIWTRVTQSGLSPIRGFDIHVVDPDFIILRRLPISDKLLE